MHFNRRQKFLRVQTSNSSKLLGKVKWNLRAVLFFQCPPKPLQTGGQQGSHSFISIKILLTKDYVNIQIQHASFSLPRSYSILLPTGDDFASQFGDFHQHLEIFMVVAIGVGWGSCWCYCHLADRGWECC